MTDADPATRDIDPAISAVHDLRVPLAVIQAQCERLSRMLDARQAAEIELIRQAAGHVAKTVDDILLRRRHRRAPLDVGAAAAAVVSRMRPLAHIRDQRIVVHAQLGLPRVLGDEDAVTSAIENLLHNALRHSPRGGTVRCEVEQRRDRVVVRVADDGPGIPAAERERVMAAFERGEGGQSGLGLAIADRAMRAHGGRVTITASASDGAIVALELPATAGGRPRRPRRIASSAEAPVTRQRATLTEAPESRRRAMR